MGVFTVLIGRLTLRRSDCPENLKEGHMCYILELGNKNELWNQLLRFTIQRTTWCSRQFKRDRAAFTALYERCVDRVYRHVYYRVPNHDEAEDITQEAFVRAWKAIDRYKQPAPLSSAGLLRLPATW